MPHILDTTSPIIIRKAGKHFYFQGVERELLTKRGLVATLRSLEIAPHEIAFMFLAFSERLDHNEAYFDYQSGNFMGTSKYYLATK